MKAVNDVPQPIGTPGPPASR